jgi:hypothetical protein
MKRGWICENKGACAKRGLFCVAAGYAFPVEFLVWDQARTNSQPVQRFL